MRRSFRRPPVRSAVALAALAMALAWCDVAWSGDVVPPSHVALIGAQAEPGLFRLTLHPLGTRRPLPALAGRLWPSEKQLRLDTPLSVGVQYLHLAVTGGYRPGWLPFLGTSTTSVGGLRIRF